jgi:hypothetical protein
VPGSDKHFNTAHADASVVVAGNVVVDPLAAVPNVAASLVVDNREVVNAEAVVVVPVVGDADVDDADVDDADVADNVLAVAGFGVGRGVGTGEGTGVGKGVGKGDGACARDQSHHAACHAHELTGVGLHSTISQRRQHNVRTAVTEMVTVEVSAKAARDTVSASELTIPVTVGYGVGEGYISTKLRQRIYAARTAHRRCRRRHRRRRGLQQ